MKAINILDQGTPTKRGGLPPKPTHCGTYTCGNTVDVVLLEVETAKGDRNLAPASDLCANRGELRQGYTFERWHGWCARCYDRTVRRQGRSSLDPGPEFLALERGDRGADWQSAANMARQMAEGQGTPEDRPALLAWLSKKASKIGNRGAAQAKRIAEHSEVVHD